MTEADIPAFKIEPLGDHHIREAFSCGFEPIDTYFQARALDDHNSYKVRIHVAATDDDQVLGFYSLSISALAAKSIAGSLRRKFGNWTIPTVYLAAIAVRSDYSWNGLGGLLMLDAFEKTAAIAEMAGTGCMTLDAISQERADWYGDKNFERFGETPDGKIRMYIPLGTIKDALS